MSIRHAYHVKSHRNRSLREKTYKFRPVNHRRNYVLRTAQALVEFPPVKFLPRLCIWLCRRILRIRVGLGSLRDGHFGDGGSLKRGKKAPTAAQNIEQLQFYGSKYMRQYVRGSHQMKCGLKKSRLAEGKRFMRIIVFPAYLIRSLGFPIGKYQHSQTTRSIKNQAQNWFYRNDSLKANDIRDTNS